MFLLQNIHQVATLAEGAVPRRGKALQQLGIVNDGAILIRDATIEWVGPMAGLPAEAKNLAPGNIIDGAGRQLLALPGFIDSHTHPLFAGTRAAEYEQRSQGRTYQEIAESGGGIRASVRQVRAATQEEIAERAARHFGQFLAHGTTTIEAKSGYGLTVEDELKLLRALAGLRDRSPLEAIPTFLGAHDVPDEYRDAREVYVRRIIEEMIPRIRSERLAEFCDVFCDRGYFTVEESRKILLAGRDAGLAPRIHAEELSHSGGARLAAEIGARSADHLEWIDDADIDSLRDAGVVATLLPGTAFNLGLSRYPPARKLVDAGVTVALATDFNPGSCFTLNMQIILSIACSQMKLSPSEAIVAATLNGAYSLGISGRVGSLEAGKQADLVLMDVGDYRELAYFFGVNHCVLTIKKGRIVSNRLEEQ